MKIPSQTPPAWGDPADVRTAAAAVGIELRGEDGQPHCCGQRMETRGGLCGTDWCRCAQCGTTLVDAASPHINGRGFDVGADGEIRDDLWVSRGPDADRKPRADLGVSRAPELPKGFMMTPYGPLAVGTGADEVRTATEQACPQCTTASGTGADDRLPCGHPLSADPAHGSADPGATHYCAECAAGRP